MFSVGWQAVEMTTSAERKTKRSDNSHRDAAGLGLFRSGFTCMALQFLHNLLCLQVPDVNHVVLGARNDPLQETGLTSPATKTLPPSKKKKRVQQQQQCLPSHRWRRNWQICNTSRSYGLCRFSSTITFKEKWFLQTFPVRNWGIPSCKVKFDAYLSFAVVPQLQRAANSAEICSQPAAKEEEKNQYACTVWVQVQQELVLELCRHLVAETIQTSAALTYLSSVAAKMYFPFGENLTNDTGGLSSSDHKNMEKGLFYNFGQIWQRLRWTLIKAYQ